MSDPKKLTRLEYAHLLRDFIRAEIDLAYQEKFSHENSQFPGESHMLKSAREEADKLFNQIAGIE